MLRTQNRWRSRPCVPGALVTHSTGAALLLPWYLATLLVRRLPYPFLCGEYMKVQSMNYTHRVLALLLTLVAGAPALSQAASLQELEQRCQQAREAKISPLRETAIQDCVNANRSSRTLAECQRMNADFGQGGGIVGGGFRTPMFNDLPPCVEYFRARDAQNSSTRR